MKTKLITIDPAQDNTEKFRQAAQILDNGGLVAFPTETVYGIACKAEQNALDKLDKIKGRSSDKRYTLHIASVDQLRTYIPFTNTENTSVPAIGPRGRKLINNTWPGPLTAVFQLDETALIAQKKLVSPESFDFLYKDSTIGIRCPDTYIATQLLSQTSFPIIAPSANYASKPPAITADEVMEQFDGQIDMVLSPVDNNTCKYKQSSTVVKFTANDFTILREGVYLETDIKNLSTVQILFVCTGNTCRSPMAELFCKKYLAEKFNCNLDELEKFGYKVFSAGTNAYPEMGASDEVVSICDQMGIDASMHSSTVLTPELAEKSDYIFCMSASHLSRVIDLCPKAEDKCTLLAKGNDIPDPFGGGSYVYQACALSLDESLGIRLCEILT
jgi:L-threonylcarbamoyladenylate synthase